MIENVRIGFSVKTIANELPACIMMVSLGKKIARLAFFDGLGLLVMAFLSLICACIWKDTTGAMVGIALLTLGGIELQGRHFVLTGQTRATGWLVGAQMGLLFVVLAYCFRNVMHPPTVSMEDIPTNLRMRLDDLPGYDASLVDLDGMMLSILKLSYSLIMLISVFYQGAMAMYYLRKTPLALAETKDLPPPLP